MPHTATQACPAPFGLFLKPLSTAVSARDAFSSSRTAAIEASPLHPAAAARGAVPRRAEQATPSGLPLAGGGAPSPADQPRPRPRPQPRPQDEQGRLVLPEALPPSLTPQTDKAKAEWLYSIGSRKTNKGGVQIL